MLTGPRVTAPGGTTVDYGRAGGGRSGGSRADQGRADRSWADQSWADQSWASQGRADQGPANQGRPSQSWANQDQARAGRGSRRAARDAAKGRRGAPGGNGAASRMSAKDRLVAKLGTDQPAAGHAMTAGYPGSGYPGSADPRGRGARDPRGFDPRRSGRGRGDGAEMHDGNGRGGRGGNGGNGGGNGRGPGRPRRKGDWWRRWTWKKALATSLLTGLGFMILLVIGIFYTYSQTPIPAASELATGQASRVYFRDGNTLVGMFGTNDRQTLQSTQIPAMVKDAMVASEDKHFYSEGGVSPTGIMRAAIADLTSGSVQQGGSTITQQLVRNFYDGIGTSQTFTRKIKEIFVAEKLASAKSKDWILTNYMNTVPTGLNMYGFGAASEAYFGKPVGKLTVAQAAMIAAMPQSPSYYNPDPKAGAGYQALVYRWHYVLRTMVQMGSLTQAQANAQKFPKLVKAFNNSWSGYRGYIMTAVLNELENTYHYTQSQIDNGGLRITTTYSKPMMNQLYATVAQQEHQMKLDGKALPRYAHVGAVLEQPGTGEIWAMYSGPNYNAPHKECNRIRCQWDMALQNREQVGSSMKPYVLALARHQGMSVKTSTLDGYSPLWIPPVSSPMMYASRTQPANSGGWYQVGNDAGGRAGQRGERGQGLRGIAQHRVHGPVPPGRGHRWPEHDQHGEAVRGQHQPVGPAHHAERGRHRARSVLPHGRGAGQHVRHAGQQRPVRVPARDPGDPAAAARPGDVHHPGQGEPAHGADPPGGLGRGLRAVVRRQGRAARPPNVGLADGRELIAKTGTTNLSQSAFFIGAIPQFSLAIGMFTNEQGCPASIAGCTAAANQESAPPPGLQTLYGVGNLPGYGGEWPATIWHAYAQKMFGTMTVKSFPTRGTSAAPRGTCSGRTRRSLSRRRRLRRPRRRPAPATASPSPGTASGTTAPARHRLPPSRAARPPRPPSRPPRPPSARSDRRSGSRAPAGAQSPGPDSR